MGRGGSKALCEAARGTVTGVGRTKPRRSLQLYFLWVRKSQSSGFGVWPCDLCRSQLGQMIPFWSLILTGPAVEAQWVGPAPEVITTGSCASQVSMENLLWARLCAPWRGTEMNDVWPVSSDSSWSRLEWERETGKHATMTQTFSYYLRRISEVCAEGETGVCHVDT